jgi:hypothetical protein
MRKSLWIIALAFAAIAAPTAHANTIACGSATCVTSAGGYVTEIEGLNIDATLYNVTFGATDDLTFATNGEASDAASDIASALGTQFIVSAATTLGNGNQFYCVDSGGGNCQLYLHNSVLPWQPSNPEPYLDSQANSMIATDGGGFYFAEFSPDVATPEPGTATLMLLGIGLVLAMRKRVATGLQQAP